MRERERERERAFDRNEKKESKMESFGEKMEKKTSSFLTVPRSLLEDGRPFADVAPGHDARTSREAGDDVRDEVAVEVGRDLNWKIFEGFFGGESF